jgi:hypothetical protein
MYMEPATCAASLAGDWESRIKSAESKLNKTRAMEGDGMQRQVKLTVCLLPCHTLHDQESVSE